MEVECKRLYFRMCKDRSNEIRTCVFSRCCGFCFKRFEECEGLCIILKDKNLIGLNVLEMKGYKNESKSSNLWK